MSDRPEQPVTVDADAFWRVGPLPTPTVADDAAPTGPGRVGRPDLVVDGRNLADVLRPVYEALREP
jgi:hypothetical protein